MCWPLCFAEMWCSGGYCSSICVGECEGGESGGGVGRTGV